MGRPRVIDQNTLDMICGLVSMGLSRWQAARHLGIHRATLYRTMKTDAAFAAQLRKAELTQELRPVKQITEQMPKDWRAAAWVLERLKEGLWVKQPANMVTLADMHGIFGAMMKLLMEGVPLEHRQHVTENYEKFFQRLGGKKRCSPRVRRAILELELDQLQKTMPAAASPDSPDGEQATKTGEE